MPRYKRPLIERFSAKLQVDKHDCWNWTGGNDGRGYGQFAIDARTNVYAHRWSYEYYIGPIPEGLTIDHLCRNRRCCNPDHLEAVTMRENLLRGDTVAARKASQTHCGRGHEFSPENTRYKRNGHRVCRTCERERVSAWQRSEDGKAWQRDYNRTEQQREYRRQYRRKNLEKLRAYDREWKRRNAKP